MRMLISLLYLTLSLPESALCSEPAASFPCIAKEFWSMVIEINKRESGITSIAEVYLEGSSANLLSELVLQLKSLN